jgi:NADH-quinone oxidoreductase subunit E
LSDDNERQAADAPQSAGGERPAGQEQGPTSAPESTEANQRPDESGLPPVPEEGTPPGDEQAGEEVSRGSDGGVGQPKPDAGSGAGVPDELRAEIEELMARYPQKRSASIPALHAVQRRYGWCSPEGIEQAATVMDVDPAYLESVASFYDLFHLEPAGTHQILVCTNISCWMRGADELLEAVCKAAGADPEHAGHGGTVNDAGDLFVTGFECLGACDIAPMASVDEVYYGPLTEADAPTLIEQLRSGAEVLPDKALRLRPAAGGPDPEPDPRVAEAG